MTCMQLEVSSAMTYTVYRGSRIMIWTAQEIARPGAGWVLSGHIQSFL